MEQKKYTSIDRYGKKHTTRMLQHTIENKSEIVITEKVDCSNASFMKDEHGVVHVFSRNQKLDEHNTLNGFYQFAQSLDKFRIVTGYLYFGEWLGNPHKVRYEDHMKQFILFDVWSFETQRYVDFGLVEYIALDLGVPLVPVLYKGQFKSEEHMLSFVGQTKLNGKIGDEVSGEGIVVKNYNYFEDGRQVFMKIVTEKFQEVHMGKVKKVAKVLEKTYEGEFAEMTVTKPRIEKMLNKLLDEGILDTDYGFDNMPTILKNIHPLVVEDVLKEESDLLNENYDEKQLKKEVGRLIPKFVKEIILEKN